LTQRRLIVNADDFGQSPGINRGVVETYERGIVTSASLMVRWPAAEEAAAYARAHPELDLGLHIDLRELAYRDGRWVPLYEVEADAAEEIPRQLACFVALVEREPTHLDSHQHVHHDEPVKSIMLSVADELRVPLRSFSANVRYTSEFHGQSQGEPFPEGVGRDHLLGILNDLPSGITELGCHPGYRDGLETTYSAEREREVETLTDRRIQAVLDELGIELTSFGDLPGPQ
jgi:chitin disaccharide deacetylase